MNEVERVIAYHAQNPGRRLTAAQLRRIRKKRGHVLAATLRRELRPPRVLSLPSFMTESGSSVDITDMIVKSDLTPRQRRRLAAKDSLKIRVHRNWPT